MLNVTELIGCADEGSIRMRAVSLTRFLGVTSFTAPADIQKGDLLIIGSIAFTYTDAAYPTGFTLIDQQQGTATTNARCLAAYKIAAGTEGGTTISPCMNSSVTDSEVHYFLVLRPSAPIRRVALGTVTWQFTNADPANVIVPAPLYTGVVCAMVRDATSAHAAGIFTPAEDARSGAGAAQMYYKVFNSSPVAVTLALGDMGNDNLLYGFTCSVM